MAKLLWVGDAAVPTGYGRVTEQVCRGLKGRGHEIAVLGVGYNGDPHDFPYKIYPASTLDTPGYRNGATRIKGILDIEKPDAVIIQDDSWNVGYLLDQMQLQNIAVPAIGYIAIDSENTKRETAMMLRGLKHAILHTNFGLDQLRGAGYTGQASIAGHGVDTRLYTTYDRAECREGLCQGKDMTKAFIWGVVAANQPRKRLDLSLAYFAKWWNTAGCPDDAYLYLHTNMGGDWDLKQLADHLGIRGRLLASNGGTLPESHMPAIYNSLDVLIHTSEGESWGLTALESMACGVVNIATECAGLASWAGSAIHWVRPSQYVFTPHRLNTKRWISSETDFVAAMQDIYTKPELRQEYRRRGIDRATLYSWQKTVDTFDKVVQTVLKVQRQAVVAPEDCLLEFQ